MVSAARDRRLRFAGHRADAPLAEGLFRRHARPASMRSRSTCAARAFEVRVWEALRQIPAGQTTSYGAIAKALGSPGASRAVGAANGANPIAIIVPCHRVIGSSGSLTGYGGGLDRKTWLIDHERRWRTDRRRPCSEATGTTKTRKHEEHEEERFFFVRLRGSSCLRGPGSYSSRSAERKAFSLRNASPRWLTAALASPASASVCP